LVPVSINDKGPFLFMIDPDSRVSSIDTKIQSDQDLMVVASEMELTEADNELPVFYSQVDKVTIGTLNIRNTQMRVHPYGTFSAGGRRISGILGRDIIADSLVFQANRDTGMAFLATQGHLAPPQGAAAIGFSRFDTAVGRIRVNRKVASVMVNDKKLKMALDLGAKTSMLWPETAKKLGLPTMNVRAELTDEFGIKRQVNSGLMTSKVVVAEQEAQGLLMLPFGDKRLDDDDFHGVLGQNFFEKFNVTVNWHKKKFWLEPRAAEMVSGASTRIRRFGDVFNKCAKPACVTAEVAPASTTAPGSAPVTAADAAAGDPPEEGAGAPSPEAEAVPPAPPASYGLKIHRDTHTMAFDYEVLLEAIDAQGKTIGLPRLLVTLNKGVADFYQPNLDPNYAAAAKLVVVDVGPFPKRCEESRCVWQLRVKN
jgi:hypothetical protein